MPRLLDLFCGAGGAAVGYHRAGFEVVGVDHRPQPRYPFTFVRADALRPPFDLRDFDAIHASPPCQAYSAANNVHGRTDHPDLIGPVRDLLAASGRLYVIENVPGSPLRGAAEVCGLALRLGVRRHRWFESNVLLLGTDCGDHRQDYASVFGHGARGRTHVPGRTGRPSLSLARAKAGMGIDWMTRAELSQAIPPAYTAFIGKQLLRVLAAPRHGIAGPDHPAEGPA
jgi:DNA (cytosine-5)-methyltransferase 1